MIHVVYTFDGPAETILILEIARYALYAKPFQPLRVLPDETSDFPIAAPEEFLHDVASDESGSTRHES